MNIEATIIVMVYKNLNQVIQTLDSIKSKHIQIMKLL